MAMIDSSVFRRGIAVLAAALFVPFSHAQNPGLHDDRQITIASAEDVAGKRQQLINFIFGPTGMTAGKLPVVEKNDASPVRGLRGLARVDTLTIAMEADQKSYAHHFIPKRPNRRLVVLHHGHAPTFDDQPGPVDGGYGMQRTIDELLLEGYSVLAVYMPHIVQFRTRQSVNDNGSISHDAMFQKLKVKDGSVMKFFLEPMAVCLHYLKTRAAVDEFPAYEDFSMIGLSGGGWTTTVYAALDPTIRLSFPVAGTIPLWLRSGGSVGDTEQTLSSFYQIAGYPDLYVLGSYGTGRKQVQILNRRDDCCFGENQHQGKLSYDDAVRGYESQVRLALVKLGSKGAFRLEIDEAAPSHMISWNARVNTILAELNGGRPSIAAVSSSDAFVRGSNGCLWHHGPRGWQDTGLPMVGTPAVVPGAGNAFDLFYRNPKNQLMHASFQGAGWKSEQMPGVIITDPAALSTEKGKIDIVAFGGNYRPYHWRFTDKGASPFQMIEAGRPGFGNPVLLSRDGQQLDIFYRGFDRNLHHVYSSGDPRAWKSEVVGGTMLDFPTAVATPDGTLRAYVRGLSGKLFEAAQSKADETWRWTVVSDQTGGQLLAGSPSASVRNAGVRVHARTPEGHLCSFTFDGKWSFEDLGRAITGTPISTPGGVFAPASAGGLLLHDGAKWFERGGTFD
jgi:hypothetical protein